MTADFSTTTMLNPDKAPEAVGLRANQRNLYLYYVNHRNKHPHSVCYVPKMPMQSSRLDSYIRAIAALEEKGLIRVDRSAQNYTGWIMLDP